MDGWTGGQMERQAECNDMTPSTFSKLGAYASDHNETVISFSNFRKFLVEFMLYFKAIEHYFSLH